VNAVGFDVLLEGDLVPGLDVLAEEVLVADFFVAHEALDAVHGGCGRVEAVGRVVVVGGK